jgi:hypothetical protein
MAVVEYYIVRRLQALHNTSSREAENEDFLGWGFRRSRKAGGSSSSCHDHRRSHRTAARGPRSREFRRTGSRGSEGIQSQPLPLIFSQRLHSNPFRVWSKRNPTGARPAFDSWLVLRKTRPGLRQFMMVGQWVMPGGGRVAIRSDDGTLGHSSRLRARWRAIHGWADCSEGCVVACQTGISD